MATVQTLIDRSLRLIGVIASGDSPTSDETADCLTALNGMLESWRNNRLFVHAFTESTLTMTVGDASYTIGPSGDLDTTRPVKIESAFMRVSGVDYPVSVVGKDRFDMIPDKTLTSDLLEMVRYNPTMPTGTLSVWPVPSVANVLHLTLWSPVASFSAATDAVSLPPGYERAITYNLAIEAAPEFGREPSNTVQRIAMESLANIKRINSRPLISYPEVGRMFGNGRVDIETGE